MKYTFFAILIALACCGGCKTRTTKDDANHTVGEPKTIWMWQKDFWGHK